jgi:multidrug efflux pump subunit AcrA (membrane-fusion protein)
VLVPSAAITRNGAEARVWIVSEGKASPRSVELGPPRGAQIEVRSGLEGGESLILDAPPSLKDGAKVKIKQG